MNFDNKNLRYFDIYKFQTMGIRKLHKDCPKPRI